MRLIARRLRVFATVLGVVQSGAPALAVAHELIGADRAPVAHIESQGAGHDVASHAHDCGLWRHLTTRAVLPGPPQPSLCHDRGFRGRAIDDGFRPRWLGVAFVALPRGPPAG